jgi:uncharacterized protein YcbK (DUF882 family)
MIPRDRWSLGQIVVVGAFFLVIAAVLIAHPPQSLLATPFPGDNPPDSAPAVSTTAGAFGLSGEVRVQLRLPGELFEFPVDVKRGTGRVEYLWVNAADSTPMTPTALLTGTTVAAPQRPGFYRLSIARPDSRTLVDSIIVGVMIPFSSKLGASINGYQIGTYRAERGDGSSTPPRGFVEVRPENAELAVSTHFRLADFLTHDGQERWPRYVALDPRILDKVELVLRHLGSREHDMPMTVSSGFRTPLHNQRVPRAASDSRHQYGDAADLAIDVDGDGRVTYLDVLAVARAVELTERDHPELVGGLGLYGNRGTAPYVHIDVRGVRKRWKA